MTHKLDETTARTVAEFMDKMKTTPIFDNVKEIREILAGTDINSLPNDYSTVQMARDRMEEINALRRGEYVPTPRPSQEK